MIHRLREEIMRRNQLLDASEVSDLIDDVLNTLNMTLNDTEKDKLVRQMTTEPNLLTFPDWFSAYIDDKRVREVIFSGRNKVLIRKGDDLLVTDDQFDDETHFQITLHRILSPLGLELSEDNPAIYAQLPDKTDFVLLMPSITGGKIHVSIRFHRPASEV